MLRDISRSPTALFVCVVIVTVFVTTAVISVSKNMYSNDQYRAEIDKLYKENAKLKEALKDN